LFIPRVPTFLTYPHKMIHLILTIILYMIMTLVPSILRPIKACTKYYKNTDRLLFIIWYGTEYERCTTRSVP